MKVHVIDYGVGNLHSVLRAPETVDGEGVLSGSAAEMEPADRIILPGVRAYGHCAVEFRAAGVSETIFEFARSGRRLFGSCVSKQLLFARGLVSGGPAGLRTAANFFK